MSTTLEPHPQVRSPLLAATPWIILLTLAQIGLYIFLPYLTSLLLLLLFWLIGISLWYLLIGLLAALRAGGYRTREHAIERGRLIGFIVGVGGAVLATLMALLFFLIIMPFSSVRQTTGSPSSTSWMSVPYIYIPLLNLLGVAFAILGGLLGGSMTTMSTSLEPQPEVRSPLLSTAPWVILLTLIQAGFYFHPSWLTSWLPWLNPSWLPWLIGTPLCYLLISLLAAFCAGGYRTSGHAIERGALIGFIAWRGSIILIFLVELFQYIWQLYYFRTHQFQYHGLTSGVGLGLTVVLDIFSLLVNLFCLMPAALGGLLGGWVRFMIERKDRCQPL